MSSITTPSFHSSIGCLKKHGRTSKRAAAPTCGQVYDQFCHGQSHWLEDYALFRALRNKFDGAPYLKWPAELVDREPAALDRVRRELADQIGLVSFAQFLLFAPSRAGESVRA